MLFIIILFEGDEGGTHPKLDEVQTKVDFCLGFSGECSRKVSHRFFNRCDFDQRVHIDHIH